MRYQPTPEQIERRKKLRELCKDIVKMSHEQRATLAAQAGGNIITCEGRQLSPHNCALIAFQGARGCTIVGGYQQWKKAGRQVEAGEHGFSIWIPMAQKKDTAENMGSDSEKLAFRLITVFDVSQTKETGSTQAAPEQVQELKAA